jgi:hypothetical protein
MYVFDTTNDIKLTINTAGPAAGDYIVGVADFGPQLFQLTADLVLVNEGGRHAGLARPSPPTSPGRSPWSTAAAVASR